MGTVNSLNYHGRSDIVVNRVMPADKRIRLYNPIGLFVPLNIISCNNQIIGGVSSRNIYSSVLIYPKRGSCAAPHGVPDSIPSNSHMGCSVNDINTVI